jgi:hypothetical protein
MKTFPKTIHVSELEDWTTLTRQRLYQLAQAKVLPKPDKGYFPFAETIKGLFAYYNEGRLEQRREITEFRLRGETADVQLKENRIREMLREMVPVPELVQRMNHPLSAMRQVIRHADKLSKEERNDLQSQLHQLYSCVFGEKPSDKLRELQKQLGVRDYKKEEEL